MEESYNRYENTGWYNSLRISRPSHSSTLPSLHIADAGILGAQPEGDHVYLLYAVAGESGIAIAKMELP